MNVYDFDNTIYDGESSVDFFLFCIKKDKKLIKYIPKILYKLVKYKFNKLKIEEIYDIAKLMIMEVQDKINYKLLIDDFWKLNRKKIKKEFLNMLTEKDLIITGCPNFLIENIDLKTKNIICSKYNFETNNIEYICFGKMKVELFNTMYKNEKINKFYTDSLADKPLMELANEVYLVKKNKIKKIK